VAGLTLASRSPQRSAILRQLGIRFAVAVPEVEELERGDPRRLAVENALRKAQAAAAAGARRPVLGVDTVVCLDGRIYGKPEGPEQARATLEALSGREHTVLGGLCLLEPAGPRTALAATTVEFRQLDEGLLGWYVASGEWRERAGGYAIQGRGAALVRRIDGDYLNVVGLPVSTLLELAPWLLGS
jgi:septum formation protein